MKLFEKLVWSDNLTMYNRTVDQQHIKLFEMVNEILDHERLYPKSEQFAIILSNISDYGLEHFRTEEQYMREIGYPNVDEHAKEHRKYLFNVAMFNTNFKDVNHTDPKTVLRFVKGWWYSHIMISDMDVCKFISSKS